MPNDELKQYQLVNRAPVATIALQCSTVRDSVPQISRFYTLAASGDYIVGDGTVAGIYSTRVKGTVSSGQVGTAMPLHGR